MMVRQSHQQQCDDLNSVTEHSRSIPNGDAMSLPNGWENIGLGEICEVLDTKRKPITKRNRIEGEVPYYGATGIVDWVKDYIFDEPLILLGEDGAKWDSGENSAFKIEGKTWVNNHAHVLRPIREKVMDNWLIYNLNYQNLLSFVTGLTVPKLNQGNMRTIHIPIPPLDEQKRIVAKLDECFEAIHIARTNVEKNLSNAKELFQSQLNQIFASTGSATDGDSPELAEGWVEKKLGDITTILGDGLHGTPKYTIDGEYYFINGNNLDNGKIIYKNRTKRASFGEYEKYKKNLNDRTVFVSINGTLGNVAFYNNEKVILGKSACYFNLTEQADKNFIKYVILSPYFIDYAHKVATGATIKNVSLKSMRELKINLPKIEEQKEIVILLDTLQSQTQSLESNYQQELDALDELKKSILQKAFSGELTIENEEKCD